MATVTALPSPTVDRPYDKPRPALAILAAISGSHLLNDTIQSILPAIYPFLKPAFGLTFTQVGLMTLALMLTASVLQPLVGFYTDRRPTQHALVVGMSFSLAGLLLLAFATSFPMLLAAAGLLGIGSSVFHPESSRIARLASGGRLGLAQSLFQTGGSIGSAIGPLIGAFLVVPRGQSSLVWCSLLALSGIFVLWRIGIWSGPRLAAARLTAASRAVPRSAAGMTSRRVAWSLAILAALVFSKYLYLVSLTSYYTFYLMTKFHVSIRTAQIDLFVLLGAVAVGTVLGGPLSDRFGRKSVIWGSILGVLPFTLALPHANLYWSIVLTVAIGLILSSAFSAIVVFAQELVPGRVGLISGMFFGLAFGMSGVGAAGLGLLADAIGIEAVYHICAFLPAIGLLAALLPDHDTAADRPHGVSRTGDRS